MAEIGQLPENLFLELAVGKPFGWGGHVHLPRLGVVQEGFQGSDSGRTRLREVEVVGTEGCEDLATLASPADEDVQAAFPSGTVEGTEAHRQVVLLRAAVSDADENDVSLVTLDILQILDE